MAKKQTRTDAERRVRQCERLGRLLRLLQLVMSKGRWDADGLAAELESSRRTIYRLLQTLSLAGVPWYFDDTTRAYRVRPGYKFPGLERNGQVSAEKLDSAALEATASELLKESERYLESLRNFCSLLRATE